MANWYVSTSYYLALPLFATGTAYNVGDYVRNDNVPGLNSRVYVCTVAGTSGGSAPTWPTGDNATVVSGTTTWRNITGQEAHQTPGSWKPFPVMQVTPAQSACDVMFVTSDYNYDYTANTTVISASATSCIWMSVDKDAATIPPSPSDYKRGATTGTTGAFWLVIGNGRYIGFNFYAGTGSSSSTPSITCATRSNSIFEDCIFNMRATGTGCRFLFNETLGTIVTWINTKVVCAGPTYFEVGNTTFRWLDTPVDALTFNTTQPSGNLFALSATQSVLYAKGVDLSAYAGTWLAVSTYAGTANFINCKINELTAAGRLNSAGVSAYTAGTLAVDCGHDGAIYRNRFQHFSLAAQIAHRQDTYRDGGASDADEHFSYFGRMNGTLNNVNNVAVEAGRMALYETEVDVPITYTAYMVVFTSLFTSTKRNFWLSVRARTKAGVPYMTERHSSAVMPSDTQVSTADLSGKWRAPLRENNKSYSGYDCMRVASNPNYIFMQAVEGARVTGASEPAGLATATPGTIVVDGTVSWLCGQPIKSSVTLTPKYRGYVEAVASFQLLQSGVGGYDVSFVIDPKLERTK